MDYILTRTLTPVQFGLLSLHNPNFRARERITFLLELLSQSRVRTTSKDCSITRTLNPVQVKIVVLPEP